MLPKKIYLNYVNEDDEDKTWSDAPISVSDCDMQNREYTDLSQVWHEANENPKPNTYILCDDDSLVYNMTYWDDCFDWGKFCNINGITKWAYIKDLLPKTERL